MISEKNNIAISVIIPVYKESAENLASLYDWMEKENNCDLEWILIGAVNDEQRWHQLMTPSFARMIIANKGRSSQMNAGALHSTGRFLLFLHADTRLSPGWLDEIKQVLKTHTRVWGYFEPQIDGVGLLLRFAESWGLWRSKLLCLPYGDQAIFVDSVTFHQLGGFDEQIQFMEDVDLVSRLKRLKLKPISCCAKAITSARNWINGASLLYSSKNLIAICMYLLGLPRIVIQKCYVSSTESLPGFCKLCGQKGRSVQRVTLEALLLSNAKARLGQSQYYYCPTHTCEIVYFSNEDDIYFDKTNLCVRVGQKESNDPVTICYCFGHTRNSIWKEIEKTGKSTVEASITNKVKAGLCSCLTKNPQGACCLGDVHNIVTAGFQQYKKPPCK